MSQYDFGTIDAVGTSGIALATLLGLFRDAVHSGHKGSARPSYAVAGLVWIDDSADPTWVLNVYDGTDDIALFTINTTNDAVAVKIPSGTSAPTATGPGQLWLDTSASPTLLKMRNQADDAWAVMGSLSGSTWVPYSSGSPVATATVNVGDIKITAAGTAPANWAFCDGQALAKATYPDLDAIMSAAGYPWGSDATNFNVPDMQGRVPVGVGSGAGLTARALGDTGGEEEHTLIEAEVPAHQHGIQVQTVGGAPSAFQAGTMTADSTSEFPSDTESVGGGDPHENMPPFTAVNFIIRVLP